MRKLRFRKHKPRKQREIPIRTLIPNLVTLLAAASGITSILYSCQANWRFAVIAIFVASVLDVLDGRMARMLRATSKLGAELDSLADFVSFGVAPAILVYLWIMEAVPQTCVAYHFRGLFWAIALFYAMCAAFRLARFNIMIDDGPTQPYWKHFFVGLPSPGGAGLAITPIIWQIHAGSTFIQTPWIGSLLLFVCGVLMACRWPTVSTKSMRVSTRHIIPILLFAMFIIGMLVSQFWLTLSIIGFLYFFSVPICGYIFLRLRHRYALQQTPHTYTAEASPPNIH